MPIYRLKPVFKDYLWGGSALKEKYNKSPESDTVAESWELSCYPGSESVLEGENFSMPLNEYYIKEGERKFGERISRFDSFPMLVKLIDAKEPLSVQVHPDDFYAKIHEGQNGKNEFWYVVDAGENSYLYYGLKERTGKEEILESVKNGELERLLNKVPVSPGDAFYIPAGTIHAIGSGCLIAEIQENSDVTYRLYDYNRMNSNGKTRELHLDKALEVMNLEPTENKSNRTGTLVEDEDFRVREITLEEGKTTEDFSDKDTFIVYMNVDGVARVSLDKGSMDLKLGDSVFVPAKSGKIRIEGEGKLLRIDVPDQQS